MDLSHQKILVTGASQGIGRGCALELARAGADVAVNYRSSSDAAESLADEIRGMGRECLVLQGDVAEQSAIENLIEEVVKEWGELNGFVSNAAYSDRELMVDADMEGFRRTIDVSMWGAFFGVRASAQQMIRQGNGGAILVISSPHATIPIPTAMAYNMAKAAIDQMGRTAAIELAQHRIRVNIVHPGWIDTPGERKFFSEEQLESGAKNIPWGRLGQPEEIGKLAAFMMSSESDYMTGSTVVMDGGISLPWWSNRAEGKQ
ncbi:SDR family oxidoreductase [Thalassoglobus sp. JC818]|uniref:SDR family NAD(P)-dependent oxidoreductase n=1 Tax=Thalassoglobus sp. JC818 TaxID=3232136 RepID=UPI0034598C27